MDSDVSFHGDGDGHEDGGRHHDRLARVEKVGEQQHMDAAEEVEALPETLQDRSQQVPGVKECQRDQHLLKI